MVTIKDVQNIELDILNAIAKVCKDAGIPLFLAYGTFLGAVRHKGFIPWDDDIDVYIKNSDVKRFKKACKRLPSQYFVQDRFSDRGAPWIFIKVRDTKTYMPDTERDIQQGIWIDVFPLMEAALDSALYYKQIQFLYKYQSMVSSQAKMNRIRKYRLKRILREFLIYRPLAEWYYYRAWLLGKKNKSSGFISLEVEFFAKFSNDEFERVKRLVYVPYEWMRSLDTYEFEGKSFIGFSDYDSYLSNIYGSNYMIPVKYSHFNDYTNVIILE